jgi:hypothetical protein
MLEIEVLGGVLLAVLSLATQEEDAMAIRIDDLDLSHEIGEGVLWLGLLLVPRELKVMH